MPVLYNSPSSAEQHHYQSKVYRADEQGMKKAGNYQQRAQVSLASSLVVSLLYFQLKCGVHHTQLLQLYQYLKYLMITV